MVYTLCGMVYQQKPCFKFVFHQLYKYCYRNILPLLHLSTINKSFAIFISRLPAQWFMNEQGFQVVCSFLVLKLDYIHVYVYSNNHVVRNRDEYFSKWYIAYVYQIINYIYILYNDSLSNADICIYSIYSLTLRLRFHKAPFIVTRM